MTSQKSQPAASCAQGSALQMNARKRMRRHHRVTWSRVAVPGSVWHNDRQPCLGDGPAGTRTETIKTRRH